VPVTLLGARGLILMPRVARLLVLALLLIPVVRFGPRYVALGRDLIAGRPHQWQGLAMYQDSRRAAALVRAFSQTGETVLVWGYRADVFVESGLPAGTRFLDSQPLTGVLADRHLTESTVTAPTWAAENRRELTRAHPIFVVDGLGPYNPALAITNYPELQ